MSKKNHACRNHGSAWTLDELRFLERSYHRLPTKAIADILGRTSSAVRLAAHNAGISKLKMVPWTEDEKEVIRTHYASGAGIKQVCALLPGRNRNAVFAMAIKMGISSARGWSEHEIAVLTRHYPSMGTQVAQKLPGRTEAAIKLKAGALKLTYHSKADNAAHQQRWNDHERQLLQRHQDLSLPELMRLFPGRSQQSVQKARERMKKSVRLTE